MAGCGQRTHRGHFLPEAIRQPSTALPDRQRGLTAAGALIEHPHRRGEHRKQRAIPVKEDLADLPGAVVGHKTSLLHNQHPVGHGENILRPVLGDQHRGAQLLIDFFQSIQEIRGCNGVQLAGGLIQDEDFRLHGHNGGQIQQLLLAAGELGHIPVIPALNAEKAGHFRNPQTDGLPGHPQIFQAEGQLVPDLVRHDLVVRVLHHIANGTGLALGIHFVQGHAVKQNLPGPAARWGQNGFQVPQQGGLSAAAVAAQEHILSLFYGEGHIRKGLLCSIRIGKAQAANFKLFHTIASRRYIVEGISSRTQ